MAIGRWQSALLALLGLSSCLVTYPVDSSEEPVPFIHRVSTTKFTIVDVGGTLPFYSTLLGMQELSRFEAPGFLDEPFMGYAQGGRIGLLAFTEYENIEKTPQAVSIVQVTNLEEIVGRFEAASRPIRLFSRAGVRLAHVTDPSGNTIELLAGEGPPRVVGARLIVDDMLSTRAFFQRVFAIGPGTVAESDAFREVILNVGEGLFVALYEPRPAAHFPRSEQPVVAIYTTDFDGVHARVEAEGLGYRMFGEHMFLADDPSGNVVEVIRQRTEP